MKLRAIVFTIITVAACVFIANHLRRPNDDAWHGPNRHDQARQEVLEECTNRVAGLNRIIALNFDDQSTNVSEWSASATVEYMNVVGGIQRTNLSFRFEGFGSGIICLQTEPKN